MLCSTTSLINGGHVFHSFPKMVQLHLMPHIAQLVNACWNSIISVWCVRQCGKKIH